MTVTNLVVLSVFSFFIFIAAAVLLKPFAELIGLVDEPCQRKRHSGFVPLIGGVSVFLSLLILSELVDLPSKLSYLILVSSIVVLVGLVDDFLGVRVWIRLTTQFIAVLIMIVGGGLSVVYLGLEPVFQRELPTWASIAITVVGIMGLTNSFNMIDGIDGLASGQALISLLLVIGALYAEMGSVPHIEWLVMLISSVFGFFVVNTSKTPLGKIFLGDAGSTLLGFIVGWTMIYFTQPPHFFVPVGVALWCVAIPLADTCSVVVTRYLRGQSPFLADRSHLHHLLLSLGFSSRAVLIMILATAFLIGAFGVLITIFSSSLVSVGCFFGFVLFFVLFKFWVGSVCDS